MLKTILLTAAVALIALTAHAQQRPGTEGVYEAGRHYEVLPVPVRVADPQRLEVVEIFSYACVHCFTFQSSLHSWLEDLPDDVHFVRVPAVFDQSWAFLAKAYYTAEELGVTDAVHGPIFEAVHLRNANVLDPAVLAGLFEERAGTDENAFLRVLNSPGINTRVRQADAQARSYRVTGTPTMIVHGKYRIDGRMAGSNAAMLDVVDFLLARERAAQSAQP
jgi:protein dithiol oxidoreductase (disulfide-forming)